MRVLAAILRGRMAGLGDRVDGLVVVGERRAIYTIREGIDG